MNIERTPIQNIVSKIIAEHKEDLSHKYAYILHQGTISMAKNREFMIPPRIEQKEIKDNTSTQASSVLSDEDAQSILQGLETQANTTKRVMQLLHSYEEYLLHHNLTDLERIKSIRVMNRALLANILSRKNDFANLPRESLALAIILLNAEKIHLNKLLLLEFITEGLQNKRVTKISQIRKSRAYLLLNDRIRPFSTVQVV